MLLCLGIKTWTVANINGSGFNLGGDIVIGIDKIDVNTIHDIQSYLDPKKVGDSVQIKIIRDGQEFMVPLTLGKLQGEQTSLGQAPLGQLPQLPFWQEKPFGDPPLGDMYDQCVESAGKEVCINYLAGKRLELSGDNSLNKLHNERERNY